MKTANNDFISSVVAYVSIGLQSVSVQIQKKMTNLARRTRPDWEQTKKLEGLNDLNK